MNPSSYRNKLLVIFCTLSLYLTGIGLLIPMLPLLAQELKATHVQVGMLLALYSTMHLLFSPVWGKISDRIGRRPVLLIGLFGETLFLFAFALSEDLFFLYIFEPV